jgi:hypothetical protein
MRVRGIREFLKSGWACERVSAEGVGEVSGEGEETAIFAKRKSVKK